MDNTTELQKSSKNTVKLRNMIIMAAFIALSVVGAFIKIPSPVGTIGFDSAPGYFIALALGGIEGALVISIGHLVTSMYVGFPLTLPVHLFVAAQMALWAVVFRWINNKFGIVLACIAATLLNGVLSSFTMVLVGGIGAALGVMPFLAVASAVNVIIAGTVHKFMKKNKVI